MFSYLDKLWIFADKKLIANFVCEQHLNASFPHLSNECLSHIIKILMVPVVMDSVDTQWLQD